MATLAGGPAGFNDVRQTNLGIVFRAVRRAAPCSRADIAAETTLTKATTSSLVAQLQRHRLIREVGNSTERRIGRPAVLLALDDRWVCSIGLEVNVDYLTLVAADLNERELLSRHEPFDSVGAGPAACSARMASLVREAMADSALRGRTVLGVAAAVPGLVDADSGKVVNAPNLRWRGFHLREELGRHLEAPGRETPPVFVDNDANLAVIAEYRTGHRAATTDMMYLTGEVGIGAGLLVGGSVLRGADGHAGEIGHIPLLPDGPECGCGRRGCLEALAGIDAVVARCSPGPRPLPGRYSADNLATAVQVVASRAAAGDPEVRAALTEAGTWLGLGAAALINVMNPRVVILGGYFVPLAEWLLPACREAAGAHAMAGTGRWNVEVSTLGLTAAARGAAVAVIDALDRGALRLPRP